MKRILIAFITIALILLYSCTGTPKEGLVLHTQKENITTASYIQSDEAVSVNSSEITSVNSAEDVFKMPDQSFIGVWSTDELKTDQILIWEITEVSVKFNTGVSGLFGFDATAMVLDGEIVFGDGISPSYSGPEGLKGKLEFSENGVTVIYDDFGSIEDSEYYPSRYTFTIKDENSDAIVSQYKSTIPN